MGCCWDIQWTFQFYLKNIDSHIYISVISIPSGNFAEEVRTI